MGAGYDEKRSHAAFGEVWRRLARDRGACEVILSEIYVKFAPLRSARG